MLKKASKAILLALLAALVLAAQAGELLALESQRTVLPNGLIVIAVQKAELPIVVAQMLVKTGSVYDGGGEAGLASFTADMLLRGTPKRTAEAIAEEIEFVGGKLGASAGATNTTVSLSVLVKDMELGFELLSEVVAQPTFPSAEVEKQRKLILSEIARRRENPETVVADVFIDRLYRDHPYSHSGIGYQDSISGLSREDLVGFHKKYYSPNNSFLVIVGQPEKQELVKMAEKYFGGWKPAPSPALVLPSLKPLDGGKIFVVDRDVNQSYIQFGHFGLKRTDPDFNAARVMNYILGGGGFASKLLKNIRSEQGLAYSVYSYFAPGSLFEGYFAAELQTKVESTSQALSSLLMVIEKTRVDSITESELADAKSYFEGSLARKMETYGQVASLLSDQEFYGLPDMYWAKDVQEIKGLSLDSIRSAARKHLSVDKFVAVIVSKKDKLELRVEGLEGSAVEVITY